jgi:hypothetical protein
MNNDKWINLEREKKYLLLEDLQEEYVSESNMKLDSEHMVTKLIHREELEFKKQSFVCHSLCTVLTWYRVASPDEPYKK